MKKIGIQDVHGRLLDIAKEVTRICKQHDLPIYLAYGSMLGAARHKGFIPWDDDMDMYIPLKQYDKCIDVLSKELKEPYRISTIRTVKGCITGYAKAEDTKTCIDDKYVDLPLADKLGVYIDLFPIVKCDKNDPAIKKVWRTLKAYDYIYSESPTGEKWKHFVKKILRFVCPIDAIKFHERIWDIASKVAPGDYYWSFYGECKPFEIVPASYIGDPTLCQFEDTQLYGVEQPDKYLTHLFGDYMQLPPVEKRPVHADNAYLRD